MLNKIIILILVLITPVYADVTGVRRVFDLNRNTTPNVLDVTYCGDVSDTSQSAAGTGKKCRVSDLFKAADITVNGTNTGVGTTAPTQKVDVVGTVKATAFIGDGSGLTGVAASASDTAYGPSWDGDTTGIASKNALYDKFETIGSGTGGWTDGTNVVYPSVLADNIGVGTSLNIDAKLKIIGGGIAAEPVGKGWENTHLVPTEGLASGVAFSEVNSFGIFKGKLYIGYDIDGSSSIKFIPIYTWDGSTYSFHSYLGGAGIEGVTFIREYNGKLYAGQQGIATGNADVWVLDETDTSPELLFNGADSSVSVANSSANNSMFGATSFSIEFKGKIMYVGENSAGRIVDKTTTASNLFGYRLYTDASNRVVFSVDEGGTQKATTTSTTISYGVDTHIVVTWASGASPKIYINGTEASYASSTSVTTPRDDTANSLTIGNRYGATDRTYSGFMRKLRIYRNTELTSGDVTTLYGGGTVTGVNAEYLFTDGSGTTLTDSSGNSNNGTISNAKWNTGHWVKSFENSTDIFSYTAETFKGKLVVGSGYSTPIEIYSFDGSSWTTPYTLAGTGLVVGMKVYKGRLFIGTGNTSTQILSTSDPTLASWSSEANYASTLYNSVTNFQEFRGRLYAIVQKGSAGTQDVLVRDDTTATWSVVATLPTGSQAWGFEVYNDVMYIGVTVSSTLGALIYKSYDGLNFEVDINLHSTTSSDDWEAFKMIKYNGSLYVGMGSSGAIGGSLWRKTDSLGQQFDKVGKVVDKFRFNGTGNLYKTINDESKLSISVPTSFDYGIISGVNWQYIAGDITLANWTSSAPYLNRGAINWTDANLYTGGATGNIGINTGNPGTRLDVQGTVRATAFSGDGSALTGISGGTSGWTTDSSTKTTTTYNVGVGSVNPTTALDVNGTVNANAFSGNGAGQALIGSNLGIGLDGVNLAATSPKLIVSTNGNVGVNSTVPTQQLDVVGTVKATQFVGGGAGITGLTTSQWTTANTNDVYLPNNGNVGIGTSLTTTAAFTVMNGNVGIGTWKPLGNLNIVSTAGTSDILVVGGNVGIGTIGTSVSKLFLVKTAGNFSVDNNNTVTIGSNTVGNGNGWSLNSTTATYGNSSSTAGSSMTITGGASSTSVLSFRSTSASGSGDAIRFIGGSGPAEVARFAGANLGIGTSTPGALLNISSTAAQNLFAVHDNGPGDTSPFIIDSTGNVGIGTTTAANLVRVGQTGAAVGKAACIGTDNCLGYCTAAASIVADGGCSCTCL